MPHINQKELVEVPQQSVQPCVLFPTHSALKPLQKGDSNGKSVEREIPYGPLKYTCRRYNLDIDTVKVKKFWTL